VLMFRNSELSLRAVASHHGESDIPTLSTSLPSNPARIRSREAVKHGGIEDEQMANSFINDPAHWRHRAEEMRTLAEGMSSNETRQIMMRIAADYERLAERAEQRGKGTSGPKSDGDGPSG
jgi:hypothetical protein